ncbi:MAG: penicillin-binding protein 1C, partial [Candidatus Aminicenantes bacterium]|nr:penicillin-binding protein 1C [Candidatus Aminicenantes bacterium]
MRLRPRIWVLTPLFMSAGLLGTLLLPFPKARLAPGAHISLRLTDRHGVLLRELLSEKGGRSRWVRLSEVSPYLVKATLAAEDRNFFLHRGLHVPSVVRALWQNVRRGQVVSGASTISQQVVRNIEPRPRTFGTKAREAWLAMRLERTVSKEEILAQYLNRVPYGNQAFGVDAAARLYFRKPASDVSLAEAAFMAALPRAPSLANPYHDPAPALRRQREIIAAMRRLGFVRPDEADRALAEPLAVSPPGENFQAPHFTTAVLGGMPAEERAVLAEVRTTLDAQLQKKVEALVRGHVERLARSGVTNAAAIVLDNAEGDILAWVGSRDFFDPDVAGQVDGVLSPRQPGSALKPFTYALALEAGMTAATLIDDLPAEFAAPGGSYRPENYDRRYHGQVRLRSALACSYNVPAVATLAEIGTERLYRKLRDLGMDSLLRPAGYYGAGLTLGNGEVTLLELARAYMALARGGFFVRERSILGRIDQRGRERDDPSPPAPSAAFSPSTAFIVSDILSDADARVPAFGYGSPLNLPFPCAAKTGTSKDYRDNWTVGYTTDYTVGVWVGNFDGRPMEGVSGITGCGPLFRDVMLLLHHDRRPAAFRPPAGIVRRTVCAASGELASAACPARVEEIFAAGTEPLLVCGEERAAREVRVAASPETPARRRTSAGPAGPRVVFPEDGAVFQVDPVLRAEHQKVRCRASLDGLDDLRILE